MNILINASNLKVGGGLQVADSLIKELYKFPQHNFIVVLPTALLYLQESISDVQNIVFRHYDMRASLWNILSGRNTVLDALVKENRVEAVLSVFGPTIWTPEVRHLCGFAIPHLCIPESPFLTQMKIMQRLAKINLRKFLINKNSDVYYTESRYISERLKKLFPKKWVFTVTNTYNQVFDNPDNWDRTVTLPGFSGVTLLTIAACYPHKNYSIIPKVTDYLMAHHPGFQFRFVVTITKEDMPEVGDMALSHVVFLGKVNIRQCPHLYEQSDFMFLPTLLECFSANYAEAMKMEVPILTSDLGFASYLCGDAAEYFNPTDAASIGECIFNLSNNKKRQADMIDSGKEMLRQFDNAESRAQKLMEIIESGDCKL